MSAEMNRMPSQRSAELAMAAEALLAEAQLESIDIAHAVNLATANALLALYWEMRLQRAESPTGEAVAPAGRGVGCRKLRRERASEPGA
jgi:hypothetical protein